MNPREMEENPANDDPDLNMLKAKIKEKPMLSAWCLHDKIPHQNIIKFTYCGGKLPEGQKEKVARHDEASYLGWRDIRIKQKDAFLERHNSLLEHAS